MRLDYITIFPEYFAPLNASLVGKAIDSGILATGVHDLRQYTHDVHRSVDDTPFGGGAGMVMKPEPWGEALDAIVGPDSQSQTQGERTVLIIPTPSGIRFTQQVAAELADYDHLVFACGRYEGIDARVPQYARTLVEVRELSLGDYVLNGGEVAALAMTEAIVRLLPGVIGNPASLAEESHSEELAGLLEYPLYTKPASWRGMDVPDILLSGHHAKIAQWRRDKAEELTRDRRPDLVPSSD
ncbi:MAG: tRNA (guanosine(37)-N1)-methyltransferase TrmD [Propionibacteriaceae bacterium]|jgi:tRNA (guanine37-N1)-methyltransferase|nr:tRNA (guanosine(37)-N1)-methyltransferase TrmD [Propionibacteriaceae bacterium]